MIRKILSTGSYSWSVSAHISSSWLDNWGYSINSNFEAHSESWTDFESHCWVWVAMDINIPMSESWSTNT